MCGAHAFPYFTEDDLAAIYNARHNYKEMSSLAAGFMVSCPRVMWPEGFREQYSNPLVTVVEALLTRDKAEVDLDQVSSHSGIHTTLNC
jgi:hypothetical protein